MEDPHNIENSLNPTILECRPSTANYLLYLKAHLFYSSFRNSRNKIQQKAKHKRYKKLRRHFHPRRRKLR